MAENKGRPGGKLGLAKTDSRRAFSKTLARTSKAVPGNPSSKRGDSSVKPAGQGGRNQQAGGPRHKGLDAGEDRNP
jgi:hypothetical protein